MKITDTKKESYPGYYHDDEGDLYSVEAYAEVHYWAFYWSIYLDVVECIPHPSGNGWTVTLDSSPERGIAQIGQPFKQAIMHVFWDDEYDCLNADCLMDGNEGEIAEKLNQMRANR